MTTTRSTSKGKEKLPQETTASKRRRREPPLSQTPASFATAASTGDCSPSNEYPAASETNLVEPDLISSRFTFKSKKLRTRFNKFLAHKKLIAGKAVDIELFTQANVVQLFEKINIAGILNQPRVYYPNLVREFYGNLEFDADFVVDSKVGGKSVRFPYQTLGFMLGVSASGPCPFTKYNKFSEIPDLSYCDQLKIVLGSDNVNVEMKPTLTDLPPLSSLLLKIFHANITPRSSSRDKITNQDLILLALIIKGEPFNLSLLILKHMQSCLGHSTKELPYATMLTTVFNYFNLVGENEPFAEVRHRINEETLTSSKIRLTNSGTLAWVQTTPSLDTFNDIEEHFPNLHDHQTSFPPPNETSQLHASTPSPVSILVQLLEMSKNNEQVVSSLANRLTHIEAAQQQQIKDPAPTHFSGHPDYSVLNDNKLNEILDLVKQNATRLSIEQTQTQDASHPILVQLLEMGKKNEQLLSSLDNRLTNVEAAQQHLQNLLTPAFATSSSGQAATTNIFNKILDSLQQNSARLKTVEKAQAAMQAEIGVILAQQSWLHKTVDYEFSQLQDGMVRAATYYANDHVRFNICLSAELKHLSRQVSSLIDRKTHPPFVWHDYKNWLADKLPREVYTPPPLPAMPPAELFGLTHNEFRRIYEAWLAERDKRPAPVIIELD